MYAHESFYANADKCHLHLVTSRPLTSDAVQQLIGASAELRLDHSVPGNIFSMQSLRISMRSCRCLICNVAYNTKICMQPMFAGPVSASQEYRQSVFVLQ